MFKKTPLRPEEFVTSWQLADTLDTFCINTGMRKGAASVRASLYRKKGVNLKRFPRGPNTKRKSLDIKLLNQLISATTEEVVKDRVGSEDSQWRESPFC